jgi:hypothetical protein
VIDSQIPWLGSNRFLSVVPYPASRTLLLMLLLLLLLLL